MRERVNDGLHDIYNVMWIGLCVLIRLDSWHVVGGAGIEPRGAANRGEPVGRVLKRVLGKATVRSCCKSPEENAWVNVKAEGVPVVRSRG